MSRVKRLRKGFTLIELLIVIAIIGLLATLAVFAVASARQRARDARRVSDVKQVQSALELFAVNNNGYPEQVLADPGGVTPTLGVDVTCLGDGGFHTTCTGTDYMLNVPSNPNPGGAAYIYEGLVCTGGVCTDYEIDYTIEGVTAGLTAGAHTACSGGLDC